MRRSFSELVLACLLLLSFYFLAQQAAQTSTIFVREKTEDSRREKIVIDPGHGGMDPGSIGIGGIKEKDINLSVSLKLKEVLQKDGYQVTMTREEDCGLYDENAKNKKVQDLQKRIARIAEENPVLSISIHQNSYGDPTVCGPQVFFYQDSPEGEKLAECVQSCMNQIPGVMRMREKKGNRSYYLLKRSTSVMIIVECGFLTNPDEIEKLHTEAYQEKIAEAIKAGIEKYLENKSA